MSAISVVIPTYNSYTLPRALDSIKKQSLLPCEIIVIDDASSDPIKLYELEQICAPVKCKLVVNRVNRGAGFSRNVGIRNAVGEYIAFLDDDDVWHRNKLEVQCRIMIEHRSFISGTFYVPNVTGYEDSFFSTKLPANIQSKKISQIDFIKGNPFFTPTVMVRRDGFVGFDDSLRRVDDYKSWYLTVNSHSACLIQFPLAAGYKCAIGESGLTGSLHEMHSSYIQVLKSLLSENQMSLAYFIATSSLEFIKYPLRIIRKSLNILWDRYVSF